MVAMVDEFDDFDDDDFDDGDSPSVGVIEINDSRGNGIMVPMRVHVVNRVFAIRPMTRFEIDAIGDGVCNLVHDEIAVNCGQSLANVAETVMHELAHAVHHVAGLNDSSTEEEFASRSAPVWLSVYQQNPMLLMMLAHVSENTLKD